MADSDTKNSAGAGLQSAQSSVLALFLLMATAAGALNLAPARPGGGAPGAGPEAARKGAADSAASALASPIRADFSDVLETLEPLLRFLNLETPPASLDDLAARLAGLRVTTLIATLADPKDSRLGYDFDMALEAVQRAVESEGYALDRYRLPWIDDPPVTAAPAPATAAAAEVKAQRVRHERQPGAVLYRIDRRPEDEGSQRPQELLLLLLVGETPTAGIQPEALRTSLSIAWALDWKRNAENPSVDREAAVRILGPTFSGSADSLARGIKAWAAAADAGAAEAERRSSAPVWVCSGAATAVEKTAFERLSLPARVSYAATVVPDDVLLRAVFRYLARPGPRSRGLNAPTMPEGKIALLVEGGSGYGSAVFSGYGTNQSDEAEERIITIPFPGQISQLRIGQETQDGAARGRATIPLDPPSNRTSDHIPPLSPRMTVATDSLILGDVLETISAENVRYVGIVATDILDVMFLTRMIRDNCPDVQIFLVGNDLRYTDPRFTLDFRGTVIASSYPLDSRAQTWSFPFKGERVRRLFASEFDIGRYNAGLVLLNARPDPEHPRRLIVEPAQAEDLIAYGKPFAATAFDTFNRRPQIWINQVGQNDIWPLKVVPISRISPENRKVAEELMPAVVSLDPQQDLKPDYRIEYDFPLGWKLAVCSLSLLGLGLVGAIVYANLRPNSGGAGRSSWFASSITLFRVDPDDAPERHWFFLSLLDLAVLVLFGALVAPLDLLLASKGAGRVGEGSDFAAVVLDPYLNIIAWLTWTTLFILLAPPLRAAAWIVLGRRSERRARPAPAALERAGYMGLTIAAAAVALGCVLERVHRFTWPQFELPNDWLVRERGVHLFSGVSPIIPTFFLGAAFGWWAFLELRRFRSHPLLRRDDDLIGLHSDGSNSGIGWARAVAELNARFRQSVRVLDEPLTILMSRNAPLAGLFVSAAAVLTIFIWGVVWPRYIATPDGPIFDALFMLAFTAYLLIQLYSLVRFLWLWRSIDLLFRQLETLPMAAVYDRMPPVVGEVFGRFLSAARLTVEDLEIPLQQCRLLAHPEPECDLPARSALVRAKVQELTTANRPAHDVFAAVSHIGGGAAVAYNWGRRTLADAYGAAPEAPSESYPHAGEEEGGASLDDAGRRWLDRAEELLALRIVYLVSQFSAPLGILARQLIFGPLILLLAATWYPFQPQRLIAMLIWGFIIAGAAVTFVIFVKIERNEFVNRVSRTASGSLFFDRAFLGNLLPYAVPIIGFLFTAFPSLSYWLGSVIEPISRAVK